MALSARMVLAPMHLRTFRVEPVCPRRGRPVAVRWVRRVAGLRMAVGLRSLEVALEREELLHERAAEVEQRHRERAEAVDISTFSAGCFLN